MTHLQSNPLILVTNDDGINSPGLVAAVEAARTVGDVIVAAPTHQQTARGRSLVGEKGDVFHRVDLPLSPVPPSKGSVRAWHIAASPALVVRHGLATLCIDRYPDLVVSGINYGENLGNNIMISGTLGAAFQGAAQGIPALAVSQQTDIEHHYEYGEVDWNDAIRVTRRWIARIVESTYGGSFHPADGRILREGREEHPAATMPFDVLKIDIPAECPVGTEERYTRLSKRHYFFSIIEDPSETTPIGSARTHIDIDERGLAPDDDIYAVAIDRVVSITPLHLDNTAPIQETQKFFELSSAEIGRESTERTDR